MHAHGKRLEVRLGGVAELPGVVSALTDLISVSSVAGTFAQ